MVSLSVVASVVMRHCLAQQPSSEGCRRCDILCQYSNPCIPPRNDITYWRSLLACVLKVSPPFNCTLHSLQVDGASPSLGTWSATTPVFIVSVMVRDSDVIVVVSWVVMASIISEEGCSL